MNVTYRGVVYQVWDEIEMLALVFKLKLGPKPKRVAAA